MNNTAINFCRNPSSSGVTEGYWEVNSIRVIHGQVTSAFMLLFIVVGLPWNIMVVLTVIKKGLYHQPTIMLLLNLVVTDILILVLHFPTTTVTEIIGKYIFGSTDIMRCQTCKFYIFVPVALTMDSLFVIGLLSFDRFLFIYKPLYYERKANKRSTLVSIASITMLSIAIGLILSIIPGTITYDADMFCLLHIKTAIFLIAVACTVLIVIMVCNIWVIYIVQKNIKEVYKIRRLLPSMEERKSHIQNLIERVREERHKKQLHLFRVFGGLLLSNTIAWFPIILVSVLHISNVKFPLSFSSFSGIVFMSQVAVHPILETTLIADVREPLKEMVTCGLLKKKENLDTTKDQTRYYHLCCRSAEAYDDNHCSCTFMFKLIDTAVLPKDNSSCP